MKQWLRGLRIIIVGLLIIQCELLVKDNLLLTKAAAENDPFEMMYDSTERIIREIDSFPEYHNEDLLPKEDSINTNLETDSKIGEDIDSDMMSTQNNFSLSKENKKTIKELVKKGKLDDLDKLAISEDMKAQIINLNDKFRQDRFIVKYKTENSGNVSISLSSKGYSMNMKQSKRIGKTQLLILNNKINPKELAETLKDNEAYKDIEYIQPDFLMSYSSMSDFNSGEYANQNTYSVSDNVIPKGANDFEDNNKGSVVYNYDANTVIVAVIDTGIDINHTALNGYIWTNENEVAGDGIDNDGNGYIDDLNGWNFYGNTAQVYDASNIMQEAHGTHITGIITSEAADYNVKVMPLKVFGETGAYTSDIIEAIQYAEANGARVVNCSFGGTEENLALEDAIEDTNMLFVCSVGNSRSNLENSPIYPACFDLDNILSVTSSNSDGGLSYYSNFSNKIVDIAAPGRNVNSTLPDNQYGLQSGTSMSAAKVSGTAAVVLCLDNDLDYNILKNRLITTSNMLSNLQGTVINGRVINLNNAINNLIETEIIENNPEDDFSVIGYNPTQEELYQLYSSSGDVIQIAAGSFHTLVLKENGTVWSWGNNQYGQCGNGTAGYPIVITQVIGLTNVVKISAGGFHSIALKDDGTVWAWGSNVYKQIGDGTTTTRTIPVQVSGLTGMTKISTGQNNSIALKNDGTIWTWGDNSYQLGDRSLGNLTVPGQVNNITAIDIAAGYSHCLVIKSDHTVWAWGSNGNSQLGDGSGMSHAVPAQVTGLTGILSVSAGGFHSLALKSDGTVWAWGYNGNGQLGDGTYTSRSVPTLVNISGIVTQIEAGDRHSVFVKSNSTVWTCGYNSSGQLGNNTLNTPASTPVLTTNLTNVVDISAGSEHSIALKLDGTVWAWGSDMDYQLGTSPDILMYAYPPDYYFRYSPIPIQVKIFTSGSVQFACNAYDIIIPTAGYRSISTTAVVTNEYGIINNNANITYSLANSYDGVSINTSTGLVTATNVASVGSVHIIATYGSYSDTATLYIKEPIPQSISFTNSDYAVTKRSAGSVMVAVAATVTDSNGNQMPGASIVYSINGIYAGVTINSSTGVITVENTTATGFIPIRATCGTISCDATLNIRAPIVQSMTFSSSSIIKRSAGSVTTIMSAAAFDTYGDTMTGVSIVYSIVGTYTGVSINNTTGVVTVINTTSIGTAQIRATCGIISCDATLNIQAPVLESVQFAQPAYQIVIPVTGSETTTVTANAIDTYGDIMPGCNLVYSITGSYTGISINSSTGEINVTQNAQNSTIQIKVSYGGKESTTVLDIGNTIHSINININTNNIYTFSYNANNITSIPSKTWYLTYDSTCMQIVDLCAFTYTKETSAGVIPETGITITYVTSGLIQFTISKELSLNAGELWSGVLNVFNFKAIRTGDTVISIQ